MGKPGKRKRAVARKSKVVAPRGGASIARKKPAAKPPQKVARKKTQPTAVPPTASAAPWMTLEDMAIALKLHRRTVHDYVKRGCPRGPIAAIRKWQRENLRMERMDDEHRAGMDDGADPDRSLQPPRENLIQRRARVEIRSKRADVIFKELRNAREAKDMVSRTVVRRQVAAMYVRLKERFMAMPDDLETSFPSEVRTQVKLDFEDQIRQVFLETSQWSLLLGATIDDLIVAESERIIVEREGVAARAARAEAARSVGSLPFGDDEPDAVEAETEVADAVEPDARLQSDYGEDAE